MNADLALIRPILPDASVLGPFNVVLPTTTGKTYTIIITTDQDYVFSQVSNVVFNMNIQSI